MKVLISGRNIFIITLAMLISVALACASCTGAKSSITTTILSSTLTTSVSTTGSIPSNSNTISIGAKAAFGNYLVDSQGITLYWTTLDSIGHSNESGSVLTIWPVFYTSNIRVPSSLNASDFGSIQRTDGKMQTTYKGWPLYYYYQDFSSGDIHGQGINGVWFAANPASSGPASPTTTTTVPVTTTTISTPTLPASTTTSTYTTVTTSTPTTTISYPGY